MQLLMFPGYFLTNDAHMFIDLLQCEGKAIAGIGSHLVDVLMRWMLLIAFVSIIYVLNKKM